MTVRGGTGWGAHPGVQTRSWFVQLLAIAAVTAGAALVVPAAVLAAVAVVEVSAVLLMMRHHDRVTAQAALYDLDQTRRSTAVAEDLRAEVQRLHDEVARITTRTERLGRVRKEET